jgi:hypothetical protein
MQPPKGMVKEKEKSGGSMFVEELCGIIIILIYYYCT